MKEHIRRRIKLNRFLHSQMVFIPTKLQFINIWTKTLIHLLLLCIRSLSAGFVKNIGYLITWLSRTLLLIKNKVWCTSFTYMRQLNGLFRYNYNIIGLYDRAITASVNDGNINTELAITTLIKALDAGKHSKGLILYSDQVREFASYGFVNFYKEHDIIQSMGKAGCPYGNAPMER